MLNSGSRLRIAGTAAFLEVERAMSYGPMRGQAGFASADIVGKFVQGMGRKGIVPHARKPNFCRKKPAIFTAHG